MGYDDCSSQGNVFQVFFPGLYAVVNFLTFVFIPDSKNLIKKKVICFVPFSKNNSKGWGIQE